VTTDDPTAKVALRGPDGEVETLWAYDLGAGRYRLDNTPWYAYGVSYQDIVYATPDEDGQLQFERVVEKSGNRTVRITATEPFADAWLKQLVELGVSYEGSNRRYMGINVPASVDLKSITSFLTEQNVEWEYVDPTYADVHGNGRAT
jgi:hypothetical protein